MAKAKKAKEPKFKKVEDMSAAELRKYIPAEQERAEKLAVTPSDLGTGWKRAAESVLRGVVEAQERLDWLEAE